MSRTIVHNTAMIECINYSVCYQTADGRVHHMILGAEPNVMPTDLLTLRGINHVGEVLFENLGLSRTRR